MVVTPGGLLNLFVQSMTSHRSASDFTQIPWLWLSVIGVRTSWTSPRWGFNARCTGRPWLAPNEDEHFGCGVPKKQHTTRVANHGSDRRSSGDCCYQLLGEIFNADHRERVLNLLYFQVVFLR